MNSGNKKLIACLCTALVIILLATYIGYNNTALKLNEYTITSSTVPYNFSGYCIAHVSDLHNTQIGKDNSRLISMLKASEPDIIAITGDIIDSRKTDINVALDFVEEAIQIAPCYYVTGNHEARISEYTEFEKQLQKAGVTVLKNSKSVIDIDGQSINIIGVDDPDFSTINATEYMNSVLRELKTDDNYTILLSHRPELFSVYADNDIDLVLSGHTHAGQFRLPFIDGVFAPHQGFLPEYDVGLFTEDSTNMIVSGGIGNSIFPFRFNNNPEIPIIELKITQ